MAFADSLKQLPGVEGIDKLELIDPSGNVAAILENKPGKAGSLAVYNHLVTRYRAIDATSAQEGLKLFAEHSEDARQNPGKHPNIDRLFEVIEKGLRFTGRTISR
ncbi:MAG: DUF2322 family protein [Betaproteobacteria bacterium]